jgi:hypothetical protein
MRTFARQISVITLLAILLAPGLLQARTAPVRHSAQASVSAPESLLGSFVSVWNLLTGYLKNGGQLDPSGSPSGSTPSSTPPSSTTSSDNGGQLDPSGTPK